MKPLLAALMVLALVGCSKSAEQLCKDTLSVCGTPSEDAIGECTRLAEAECGDAWVDFLECSEGKLECTDEGNAQLTADGTAECQSHGAAFAGCATPE